MSSADLLYQVYNYSATANNGQVQSIDYYDVNGGARDTARSVAYTYDAWGRLSTAQTADLTSANTWKLQWTYDRLGNRLSQTEPGGTLVTTRPDEQNRLVWGTRWSGPSGNHRCRRAEIPTLRRGGGRVGQPQCR